MGLLSYGMDNSVKNTLLFSGSQGKIVYGNSLDFHVPIDDLRLKW